MYYFWSFAFTRASGHPSDICIAFLWTFSNYHPGLYTCPAIYPCVGRCVVSQLMEAWLTRGWDLCFTQIWSIIGISQALVSLKMGSSSLEKSAYQVQCMMRAKRFFTAFFWCPWPLRYIGLLLRMKYNASLEMVQDSFWFRRPKLKSQSLFNSRTCQPGCSQRILVSLKENLVYQDRNYSLQDSFPGNIWTIFPDDRL